MHEPNIPAPFPVRIPSVSISSTGSESEQHHPLIQSGFGVLPFGEGLYIVQQRYVDEYNNKSRIIEGLQRTLITMTANHEAEKAELTQQIDRMQKQIDELTLLASNGTVADWIGDVFKFFCIETVNKARKNNKQSNDAKFASSYDLLAALDYHDNDLEEDDNDDEEDKAIKQQRANEKKTALRIVNDVLSMNAGTLVELDGVRNGRNGLRHFIDSKRFKDQAYMAQQLTAFHLKVEVWGRSTMKWKKRRILSSGVKKHLTID
ncbi:hypothetical protein HDU85_001430 [Gaertneriomyces sp. JEL0708]|nr:hypothetical protein HDU85_001430 [Gaertneriomyces sp. JEL0708]